MFAIKVLAVVLLASLSSAQPPPGMGGGDMGGMGDLTCAGNSMTRCPMTPPFQPVTVTTNDEFRLIETSGCPPYPQNWTVMQEACINTRTIEIPLTPKIASTPVPIVTPISEYQGIMYLVEDPVPVLGSIGIFDNGVYIYGSSSPCGFGSVCPNTDSQAPSNYVDAVGSEGDTIDYCGGHPTPIDLEYHVHSAETFTASSAGRALCQLQPDSTPGEHSVRLGWIYDGFGLYGRYSLNGEVPTDLDECGGHTHEIDGVMTYHYHIPDSFPWIIGCFKGCPRIDNNPQQLAFATDNVEYGCQNEDPTNEATLPGGGGASRVEAVFAILALMLMTAFLL